MLANPPALAWAKMGDPSDGRTVPGCNDTETAGLVPTRVLFQAVGPAVIHKAVAEERGDVNRVEIDTESAANRQTAIRHKVDKRIHRAARDLPSLADKETSGPNPLERAPGRAEMWTGPACHHALGLVES
jgi:hypothetical protein